MGRGFSHHKEKKTAARPGKKSRSKKRPILVSSAQQRDEMTEEDIGCARAEIREIYQAHCPELLDKVPALLKKFKGRELQLLQKVRSKYGGARHETEDEGHEVTTTKCDGCGADCSARSWFVEKTGEDYCDDCHKNNCQGNILQLNGVTVEQGGGEGEGAEGGEGEGARVGERGGAERGGSS
jgi:hypothetical protein